MRGVDLNGSERRDLEGKASAGGERNRLERDLHVFI